MNFLQMSNKLKLYVASLPIEHAKDLVNQAWRDVLDSSSTWTFNRTDTVLITPALVSAGTAAIVQGTTTITLDAVARAALNAAPDLALIPASERQFRIATATSIYNITAYNSGTGVLTLDRIVVENSNPASTYQIFKSLYAPPSSDFLQWTTLIDVKFGFNLDVLHNRDEVDWRDPQRTFSNQPYWLAAYKARSDGLMLYEMWPYPTDYRIYPAAYQKRGVDFAAATDSPPPNIPSHLLLDRARFYAYEWAEANKGSIKELQATDWKLLKAQVNAQYQDTLKRVRRQDEEIALLGYINQIPPMVGPRSARFAQSHDPRVV